MPELKRYRCTANGGYELVQTESITAEQQQQVAAFLTTAPVCEGFFKYSYKQADGIDCEAFTACADVLGYVNANHQQNQPEVNNGSATTENEKQ